MVEGQIDMLQMVAHGFKNTIATCGASRFLNKELISVFQRHKTNEVVAIPDGDDAGRRTCLDVCDRFADFGDIFVKIGIPDFGDPDEILKEFGAEGMKKYIDKAVHPVQYFIERTWTGLRSLTEELKFLDVVSKYINRFSVAYREMAAKLIEEKYAIVSAMDYFMDHSANPRDVHNKDAEGAILRAVVSNKELAYVIRQELSGVEFYVQHNREIWRVVNDCINKYGAINDEVLTTNLKKPVAMYWEGVKRTGLDIDYCVAVVKELYVRRTAAKSASKLLLEAVDLDKDVDTIMLEHRAAIVTISDKRGNLAGSSIDLVADTFADLYIERAMSGRSIVGVPLAKRWDVLNRAWSGFELGYVHVISAPTGVGKTSIAVNWFTDMIVPEEGYYQPTPALFISAEMTQQDIWCRCLSSMSGLSNTMIRLGQYPQGSLEWEKMMGVYTLLKKAPGYIVVPTTFTIGEILGIIEYHRLKYGVRHVFIDYLQLIRAEGHGKKWEVLDDASTRLQNRAMNGKDPVCIIGVAQQNARGAEDGFGSAETMGGAYKISQDAAKLVIFNKKKYKDIEKHDIRLGNMYMNISKVRMGPSGMVIGAYYDSDIKVGSLRAGEASCWDGEFRMPTPPEAIEEGKLS
jgi:replicative DNA helicase